MTLPESKLTKQQYKSLGPKPIEGYDPGAAIWAHVRFDDECGNAHNTFAITASVREPGRGISAGGCMHEEIVKAFPELAPLIKWHLCSTDGPMHYLANTLYLAGNKDCNGRDACEPSNYEYGVRFNSVPVTHRIKKSFYDFLLTHDFRQGDFQVFAVAHPPTKDTYKYSDNYSLVGYSVKWYECPFHDKTEADEFCEALNTCDFDFVKVPTAFSEGKLRELDAARHAAIWPDATDEELTAPDLKEKLIARLPALMIEFKAAMESLGFTY